MTIEIRKEGLWTCIKMVGSKCQATIESSEMGEFLTFTMIDENNTFVHHILDARDTILDGVVADNVTTENGFDEAEIKMMRACI